jgi:hypothetical protein
MQKLGSKQGSEPPVLDWNRIIHKNMRSKDNEDASNVAGATRIQSPVYQKEQEKDTKYQIQLWKDSMTQKYS